MRRVTTWAALAAMAIGTTGCWLAPGAGPDRRAHNDLEHSFDAGSVAGFTELWSAQTDETGPRGVGHPIVTAHGTVHVTTTRSVYAFDGATGARRWVSTPDTSTPEFAEVDTDLFVLNDFVTTSVRLSGNRWEAAQCTPRSGGCDTLGGELPGRIEAVRETAGRLAAILSEFTEVPGVGTVQTVFPWAGGGVRSEVTTHPGRARITLGTDKFFHAGLGSGTTPINRVQAFTITGGPGGWATPIDGTGATSPVLSADGATVYVGTDAGTLYALATADGAVRWTAEVSGGVGAAPALDGATLFVPDRTGSLLAFAAGGCGAATCEPLWEADAGSPIVVQPAVAAGVVFTGSDDGSLHAFAADGCGEGVDGAPTCEPRWSASTGSPITGAPAISLGKVFVGTGDGRLIAYGLPPS